MSKQQLTKKCKGSWFLKIFSFEFLILFEFEYKDGLSLLDT